MIWLAASLATSLACVPVGMSNPPACNAPAPQPVISRPMFEPLSDLDLIPPPPRRNRFRPKRLPTE